jgi:4-amino-4-deoxy-L-arabinose transferase-like glycosyltransferase
MIEGARRAIRALKTTLAGPVSWRSLGLLFVCALVVRLAHVLAMTSSPYFTNPVVDAGDYATIGWSIARGHGYPEAVFWHPPGYPCFLGAIWWLVGDSFLAPRLVQACLGAMNVVAIAWLGGRLFGQTVGIASGGAAAIYGMLIYFDGELLTPTLAIFAIMATVVATMLARQTNRRALWACTGVLGGLSGTIVATSLVVPVLAAVVARKRAHWVLLGTALAIAPVTARNLIHGHEFVLLSSNGGINFWIGNNPRHDKTVNVRPDVEWKRLTQEPARAGVHGQAAASRYFVGKSLKWAVAEPWSFARLQAHKLRQLISGDEVFRNHAIYPARMESPILSLLLWKIPLFAFPFGLLLPLAAVGLWIGWRRARFLAALVLGLAIMVLAFFVAARYRMVLVPFLLIFAAQAVHWFATEARRTQRLAAGACALALFLLANVGQGAMDMSMNPDAEYSLASQLGARGHMREARALFESVVEHRPDYVEAWLNLSVCYADEGRVREAKYALARAFEVDREAATSMVRQFATEGKPQVAERLLSLLREMAGTSTNGKIPMSLDSTK